MWILSVIFKTLGSSSMKRISGAKCISLCSTFSTKRGSLTCNATCSATSNLFLYPPRLLPFKKISNLGDAMRRAFTCKCLNNMWALTPSSHNKGFCSAKTYMGSMNPLRSWQKKPMNIFAKFSITSARVRSSTSFARHAVLNMLSLCKTSKKLSRNSILSSFQNLKLKNSIHSSNRRLINTHSSSSRTNFDVPKLLIKITSGFYMIGLFPRRTTTPFSRDSSDDSRDFMPTPTPSYSLTSISQKNDRLPLPTLSGISRDKYINDLSLLIKGNRHIFFEISERELDERNFGEGF